MSDPIFLPLEYFSNNRSGSSNVIDRYLNEKIDFAKRSIAVSYIHFYDVFYNVSQANGNSKLRYQDPEGQRFEIQFPDGTFTFRDFNNYMHFVMKGNNHVETIDSSEVFGISLTVNSVLNKLSFRIRPGYRLIIENDATSEFLGVDKGEYHADFSGQHIPNITMSNDSMFVHCNVVNNSLIPEVSDVIFTCPINKSFGQHVNFVPNEKRYLTCTNANTQNIKITLTTQSGVALEMTERKWGIGLDIR